MKKVLRIGVAVICMVAIVVGYYNYLSRSNASVQADEEAELSEYDAIMAKDFVNDYPATPRAVVKWYNRIIKAFYDEEYTGEQLSNLADQARSLLDEDLLMYNPKEQYLVSLTADIEDYHNRNRTIVSSTVCSSGEVDYRTVKGHDCAFVSAYYFIREGSSYTRTYEDYCLRKDSAGHWKILTWELSAGDDTDGF